MLDKNILSKSDVKKLVKIGSDAKTLDSIHNFIPYAKLIDYIADKHPNLLPKIDEI